MDKPKRKKPNRAARMKRKAEDANIFNKSFSYGYEVGYNQAIRDLKEGKLDYIDEKNGLYKKTL